MEKEQMDTEVKPTWRLAWGLWWKMALMTLGALAIIWLLLFLVGVALVGV